MNQRKKLGIIIGSIIILLIIAVVVFIILQNTAQNPEQEWKQYVENIKQANYEAMYDSLSSSAKEQIGKEDFIKRNKNIYEGMEATNLTLQLGETKQNKNNTKTVSYTLIMDTVAGPIQVENKATYRKEGKNYKLDWTSNDIFPQLNTEDKIKVKTTTGERGNIFDRNGTLLAGKGTTSSIGLVPGKMSENKEQDISKIAKLLETTPEAINKLLNASYVKEDTFVAIKTVSKSEQTLKDALLQIKGIKIIDTKARIYPYAEKTSHLLGYVQPINAEELETLASQGYHSSSILGKSGIEKEFEEKLRAMDGCEILLIDGNGKIKQTIASKEKQNGQDVKLTIDINLQTKLYDQFAQDKSASVIMNYQTGEILALVSTPTFNSNDFALGMSSVKWKSLNEDERKPLLNRYKATWAPGSSFKPIIGAIGITTQTLNPEENFGRSGLSWQKDSSWGNYQITTLTEYGDNVNLKNALIHSDNIYFAKVALKIGKEELANQLVHLGFSEKLPFEEPTSSSIFGTDNKIDSEIQLADTGYGQGKVLVNPIHMASIYSSLMNEGNMIKPYLEYTQNTSKTYWKENVFTKEAAEIIKQDLIQVVENPQGTAHSAKVTNKIIAGKTGTAEIKTSKEDTSGTELGWFNAFTTQENQNPILIISMVEDVKNKGGSHYLLPKIKTIFQE